LKIYHFDGRTFGIVNFENRYFIDIGTVALTIGIFAEMMLLKLDGGLATTAWWKNKVEQSIETWIISGLILDVESTRKRFATLAYKLTSFLGEYLMKLVDIPAQLFSCCSNPSIISMDGIVLSVEQDRIQQANLASPWLNGRSSRHRATTRSLRNVVQNASKHDRNLLLAFSTTGIEREELEQLERSLTPELFGLLDLVKKEKDGMFDCSEPLQPFFNSCSKIIFPAVHYLPASVWAVSVSICNTRKVQPEQFAMIATNAPLFSQFLGFMMVQSCRSSMDSVLLEITTVCLFCRTYPSAGTELLPGISASFDRDSKG
jgi:hypothetical protein